MVEVVLRHVLFVVTRVVLRWSVCIRVSLKIGIEGMQHSVKFAVCCNVCFYEIGPGVCWGAAVTEISKTEFVFNLFMSHRARLCVCVCARARARGGGGVKGT